MLGLVIAVACAPEHPTDVGPTTSAEVVAVVDGRRVPYDELQAAANVRAGRPQEIDWNKALESWVSAQIVSDELTRRGLDETDAYRQRLEAIRSRAWRSEQELARDALVADIDKTLKFSDEELRTRYEEQRDRFQTTRLRLRQITVPDRETIRAIQKQVQEGEDFARIAAEANLDPALRRSSGDTGWVEQRKMPTALIGPAHRLLEAGEVSKPFQDREARWNLVQLIGRDQGVRRQFDEVKDQLERELRVIRSREVLAQLVEERRAGVSASLQTAP